MSAARIKFILANWVLAAIAVFLLAGGLQSIFPDTRPAEPQVGHEQRAAQAMCADGFGPNVEAVWTDATTVECVGTRARHKIFGLKKVNF